MNRSQIQGDNKNDVTKDIEDNNDDVIEDKNAKKRSVKIDLTQKTGALPDGTSKFKFKNNNRLLIYKFI